MPGRSTTPLVETIRAALAAAPAWVRAELTAKDPAARQRAEEVLAAMIEVAIRNAMETPSAP